MLKWFSALALVLVALPSRAQDFDYYLLALSWTPSWCAADRDAEGAEQCAPDRDLGFALHGLWPQYEDGWPEFCDTSARDPSRRETAAMADVMGSGGLAWYQWRKHGRCSGLDPAEYFALARMAVALVSLPEVGGGRTTAAVLESLFLDEGPALDADELIVTCRSGRLAEVASASPANSIRAAARRTCSPTPAIGATR